MYDMMAGEKRVEIVLIENGTDKTVPGFGYRIT